HRSEAINLAGAETFDRAAVEAALTQSREAEARGRGRLEGSLLDVMERLDQADRQRLAPGLSRRGREGRRERGAPRGGEARGGGGEG
ncbi:MAG TPA: periplasmic heavy metal sensor, partial [Brevundimonas sp.]|uniref:periplasmic heavy metal sensor n=1 Tax=Brevundimonas sp. TaxID=1871086 RepID=UPI002B8B4349